MGGWVGGSCIMSSKNATAQAIGYITSHQALIEMEMTDSLAMSLCRYLFIVCESTDIWSLKAKGSCKRL